MLLPFQMSVLGFTAPSVSATKQITPLRTFSKVFYDPANPHRDFGAVMTCSRADEACPTVAGASFRIAIRYDDPEDFDGTDQEARKYDECCRQIGREVLFVFSLL